MYKVISQMSNEEQNLKQDIQFLYEIIDKDIGEVISSLSSKIYDYQTALAAKKFYDKVWFCNYIASVESKIKLATLLKNLCASFGVSSLVWDGIIMKSTMMLEQIDILQNKDNFRKSFEG